METYDIYDPYGDDHSDRGDLDFLEVDLVRSMHISMTASFSFSASSLSLKLLPSCFSSGKSDSVLAMADATLDHLEHDALFLCHLEPSIFAERLSPYHGSPPVASSFNINLTGPLAHAGHIRRSSSTGSSDLLQMKNHQTNAPGSRVSRLSAFLKEMESDDGQEALLNNQVNERRRPNGELANDNRLGDNQLSSKGQAHRAGMVKGRWARFSPLQYHLMVSSPGLFYSSCQYRSPRPTVSPPPHFLPPAFLHFLLLRSSRKPPLPLPPR